MEISVRHMSSDSPSGLDEDDNGVSKISGMFLRRVSCAIAANALSVRCPLEINYQVERMNKSES